MPLASANAEFENGESTEIPSTDAPPDPKTVIPSEKVHISLVHTPVKAAGKKASTTLSPLISLRVTEDLSWAVRVKSGAVSPMAGMVGPRGTAHYICSGESMPNRSSPVEIVLAVKSHRASLLVIVASSSAARTGQDS